MKKIVFKTFLFASIIIIALFVFLFVNISKYNKYNTVMITELKFNQPFLRVAIEDENFHGIVFKKGKYLFYNDNVERDEASHEYRIREYTIYLSKNIYFSETEMLRDEAITTIGEYYNYEEIYLEKGYYLYGVQMGGDPNFFTQGNLVIKKLINV